MIESVLNQTYINWELCIADGSSTDAVENYIREHYSEEKRIKFKKLDKNYGISGNMNGALEMAEELKIRLQKNHKTCSVIGLGIGYSKNIGGGFYHQVKLNNPTDQEKDILANCLMIFDKFYENLPIRKVTISCGNLQNKDGIQLNLFEHLEEIREQEQIDEAILEIKDKFGKNAILKASSLLDDSTIKERNKKIGGHSA